MSHAVDTVIEVLEDGRWHTIREISRKTKVNDFKIEVLATFLADYSFLDLNRREKKAKLSKVFAEFLKKMQR